MLFYLTGLPDVDVKCCGGGWLWRVKKKPQDEAAVVKTSSPQSPFFFEWYPRRSMAQQWRAAKCLPMTGCTWCWNAVDTHIPHAWKQTDDLPHTPSVSSNCLHMRGRRWPLGKSLHYFVHSTCCPRKHTSTPLQGLDPHPLMQSFTAFCSVVSRNPRLTPAIHMVVPL